jgi:DNA-binding XRE family transcriptional regulator
MALYDMPFEVPEGPPVEVPEKVSEEPHEEVQSPQGSAERLEQLITSGEAERMRRASGMTAETAARALGISGQGFRGYETGKFRPAPERAESYLVFLDKLAAGEHIEPEKPKKRQKLNGLHCKFCKRPLYGRQKSFDTSECRNSYAYIKKMNPEATNSEIKTLIAGVGWQDNGHKRRKYKRLDQLKAEVSRERASKSEVPALSA